MALKKFEGRLFATPNGTENELVIKEKGKGIFDVAIYFSPIKTDLFELALETNVFKSVALMLGTDYYKHFTYEKALKGKSFLSEKQIENLKQEKIKEEELTKLRLSLGEGELVHGFVSVNDYKFYTIGTNLGGDYYKFFVLAPDSTATLTLLGNDKYINCLFCGVYLNDYDMIEGDLAIGNIKERKITGYDNAHFKLDLPDVDVDIIRYFKNLLSKPESVLKSIETIEENFKAGAYKCYDIEKRFNPLPLLEKEYKLIESEIFGKYKIKNWNDISDIEKDYGIGEEVGEFVNELCQKASEHIVSDPNIKMNQDAKDVLQQAIVNILLEAFYSGSDVKVCSLIELTDNYDFCNFIFDKEINSFYIENLMLAIPEKEMLIPKVLSAYTNLEKLLLIENSENVADECMRASSNNEISGDNESVLKKNIQFGKDFLQERFEQMGFSGIEILKLYDYYRAFDAFVENTSYDVAYDHQELGTKGVVLKACDVVHDELINDYNKRLFGKEKKSHKVNAKENRQPIEEVKEYYTDDGDLKQEVESKNIGDDFDDGGKGGLVC